MSDVVFPGDTNQQPVESQPKGAARSESLGVGSSPDAAPSLITLRTGGLTETVVVNPTERQVALLTAIQNEIQWMAGATLQNPARSGLTWTAVLGDRGPFAIIKRKAARFRMPRALKSELIDRFVAESPAVQGGGAQLKTLVVVAHPDDESIGAGARLRHLGDAYVVDVTDGAPRDHECARRHGFQTREQYAEARMRELTDALRLAGLPEDRLVSLGFVDGELTLRLVELCLRVTELIDSLRPHVILTHPYEGGHTDHDATAFAVHVACGVLRREGVTPPAVLELASYHARDGQKVLQQFLPHERADRDQRVVELSEEDRELKVRMFECFTTQRDVVEQFNTAFERFRPAPRYNFTLPPHEGILNYERYGNPTRGQAWREQAERVLRFLRMRG